MKPDPAADLVGSLRWIMERLEAIETMQGEVLVLPAQAGRELGYKPGYLNQPWRIPGFGLKGRRHSLSTWRAWIANRTDAERRSEWEALPLAQRRRARKAA